MQFLPRPAEDREPTSSWLVPGLVEAVHDTSWGADELKADLLLPGAAGATVSLRPPATTAASSSPEEDAAATDLVGVVYALRALLRRAELHRTRWARNVRAGLERQFGPL